MCVCGLSRDYDVIDSYFTSDTPCHAAVTVCRVGVGVEGAREMLAIDCTLAVSTPPQTAYFSGF